VFHRLGVLKALDNASFRLFSYVSVGEKVNTFPEKGPVFFKKQGWCPAQLQPAWLGSPDLPVTGDFPVPGIDWLLWPIVP
jgi:hypothetical protein